MIATQFGYFPQALDWTRGEIAVRTMPGLPATVDAVSKNPSVEESWIYAPPARSTDIMSGKTTARPCTARVFGLPKTHTIEHANGSQERLDFLVWCLGFILGMRLTTTDAGFLDATPIGAGTLHDIEWCGRDCEAKALECADAFWAANTFRPRVSKALTGVIHSYFLAQSPGGLCFERFTHLYVALEGCHFVRCTILGRDPRSGTHKKRIANLCSEFGMPVPSWASPSSPNIADRRNETLHEGLFFDEPLGFAVFGGQGQQPGTELELLQMKALAARLIVALLGMPATNYIQSALNTRERFGVTL